MSLLGGLIGGAFSLLGGRSDRKQRSEELAMQDPQYIRDRAEAAGFNPTAFTNAAFGGVGYAPRMGQSIANAGAMVSDGMMRQQQHELEVTRLEMEKKQYEDIAKRATLGNNRPGVFQSVNGPVRLRRNGQYRSSGNSDVSGDRPAVMDDAHGPSGSPHAQPSSGRQIPQREVLNLYIDVYDSDTGRWLTIPNPELTESGPTEIAAGMATIAAADAAQNGLGLNGRNRSDGGKKPSKTTGWDVGKTRDAERKERKRPRHQQDLRVRKIGPPRARPKASSLRIQDYWPHRYAGPNTAF